MPPEVFCAHSSNLIVAWYNVPLTKHEVQCHLAQQHCAWPGQSASQSSCLPPPSKLTSSGYPSLFFSSSHVKRVPTLRTLHVLFPRPRVLVPNTFTGCSFLPFRRSVTFLDLHCISKLKEYQFPTWSFLTSLYFSALSLLFSSPLSQFHDRERRNLDFLFTTASLTLDTALRAQKGSQWMCVGWMNKYRDTKSPSIHLGCYQLLRIKNNATDNSKTFCFPTLQIQIAEQRGLYPPKAVIIVFFPQMIDLPAPLSYSICLNDETILQKLYLCVTYSDMQRM